MDNFFFGLRFFFLFKFSIEVVCVDGMEINKQQQNKMFIIHTSIENYGKELKIIIVISRFGFRFSVFNEGVCSVDCFKTQHKSYNYQNIIFINV